MRRGEDDEARRERALAHPMRKYILETLAIRGVISAADLADEEQVSQGTALYHLLQLEDAGLVEVAEVHHDGSTPQRIFRATPSGGVTSA